MSQSGSQISSGNTAPTVGPQKDTKEVIVLAGVVFFLGGLLAAAWLYIAKPVISDRLSQCRQGWPAPDTPGAS